MSNFKVEDRVWVKYMGEPREGIISNIIGDVIGYEVEIRGVGYSDIELYTPEQVFDSNQSLQDFVNNEIKKEKDIFRHRISKMSFDEIVDYIYDLQKEIDW